MEWEVNTQSQNTAIDIDKNGKYLVIGGREILKLIDIEKKDIKSNLRKQGNNKIAAGYVEFNKMSPNKVLAASILGSFSVWDIQSDKSSEIVYVKEHTSAINRMNWRDSDCCISGAQDYQIIYYDTRKNGKVFTLQRKDPVKDVKFNISDYNYFMAATEGLLEYFDMRKTNDAVSFTQTSSNLITCMDWTNFNQQQLLASGSNDKEIKIWSIEKHSEIKEYLSIIHIDGISHLKWHKIQQQSSSLLLSVSALNRDSSVTTYDISTPFRPLKIIKGHNDVITSFVFNQDETYLYTCSKDKYMKAQLFKESYKIYDHCPILPVAFNQYNDLLLKLEHPNSILENKSWLTGLDDRFQNQFSSGNSQTFKEPSGGDYIIKSITMQNIDQRESSLQDIFKAKSATTNHGKSNQSSRQIVYLPQVTKLFDEEALTFEEELDFLQKNYNSKKNFQYNSNVASQIHKKEIAHYWQALDHLINDYRQLSDGNPPQNDSPVQFIQQVKIIPDEEQLKSPIQEQSKQQINKLKQNEKRVANQLDQNDLKNLYKYFERYPEAFRQELEHKNIIIEDQNLIKIHFERIPYYKNLLKTMTPLGQLLTDKITLMKAFSNSILNLIQYVIDLGELTSGFWMAACAKNIVTFPEEIAKKWTLSYIGLLVQFGKSTYAMKTALESPVEQLRNSNKYVTNFKCLGSCKQSQATGSFCNVCKENISCSICFKPVRGLYFWCQGCLHGGHMKEMKQWFLNNSQCPLGCGHNCFDK